MALHLVQYLAVFLAETITGLLQRVLTHPARGLVDDTNAALLTQEFWVQAIYTELLCASSRHREVREQEKQRPPTGLAKVVCLPFDGTAARKHGRRNPTDARFETMLGGSSWVDSLFVWFPASWMPLVVEAIREKSFAHHQVASQMDAPASTDQTQIVLTDGLDFTYSPCLVSWFMCCREWIGALGLSALPLHHRSFSQCTQSWLTTDTLVT